MAAETIRVHGLRELELAFSRLDSSLPHGMLEGLKKAGELVKVEAQHRFSGKPSWAFSASGYRVVNRARGVSVEQSLRKTTGQHGQYGSLQMTKALLPALSAKENEVMAELELMLDGLGRAAGF